MQIGGYIVRVHEVFLVKLNNEFPYVLDTQHITGRILDFNMSVIAL